MGNEEIRKMLDGIQPPEDLFAQMARQKDGFAEAWLGVRKISRADLDRDGWAKDLRPTGEEPPAMLWCSQCEKRVVVAWMSQTEADCRGVSYTKRGIRLYDHDAGAAVERWQGDRFRCPCCGAKGWLYSADGIRNRSETMIVTVPYVRNGVLLLVQWFAVRYTRLDETAGWRTEQGIMPVRAYVVDGGKVACWRKAERGPYSSTLYSLPEWEKLKRCRDHLGIPYFYCKRPPDLRGTALEKAKLWELMKETYRKNLFAPLAYIRLYLRHTNAEVLITSGCGEMLAQWIKDECEGGFGYYGPREWLCPRLTWIHWKERRPSAMLGLTRAELRKFLTWKADTSVKKFWLTTGHPEGVTMEEIQQIRGHLSLTDAEEMLKQCGSEWRKTLRYLARQKASWHTLRDYWDMQNKRLGVDVTADPALAWPPHLREAHDRVAEAVRYEEDKHLEQKFAAMTERLQGLAWAHGGICIRPAASVRELVEEGRVLHHCVGGYGRAHCSGKCIFFIRHTRKPSRSWYTLQVDVQRKEILQNHGYCNEYAHGRKLTIPQSVQDFVALWKQEVLDKWTLSKPKNKPRRADKSTAA